MSEIVATTPAAREGLDLSPLRRHGRLIAAIAVTVVGIAGAMFLHGTSPARPAAMPTSAAIEAKWGVRVVQVASTGDGGMVDFRFIVLDADKATEMMSDVNNLPVLIPESQPNAVIYRAASMGAPHDLHAGETYFLLYQNTNGAVRAGSLVTVEFRDLRLQHVVAK